MKQEHSKSAAPSDDEQLTTRHDYNRWMSEKNLGARWVRFWFSPKRTLFLNTPVRKLPDLLSLKKTDKVLDIGCGYGGLLLYLKSRVGFTAVMEGLDCSDTMVRLATDEVRKRGLAGQITIRQGVATTLPYPDSSLDVVLSTYVLKHLSGASCQEMFAEVMRVLKPGGKFCLWEAGPSRYPFLEVFNLKLMKMGGVSVVHLRTAEQLREDLAQAGFSELQPYGDGPYYYYPPLPRIGFIATRPL